MGTSLFSAPVSHGAMPFPFPGGLHADPGSTRLPIHVEAFPWGVGGRAGEPLRTTRGDGGPSRPPVARHPLEPAELGGGPAAQPASPLAGARAGICRGGLPGSTEQRPSRGLHAGRTSDGTDACPGGSSSAPGVAAGPPLPTSPQRGARSLPHAVPQTGQSPHPDFCVESQAPGERGSALQETQTSWSLFTHIADVQGYLTREGTSPLDRLENVPGGRNQGERCVLLRCSGIGTPCSPRAHTAARSSRETRCVWRFYEGLLKKCQSWFLLYHAPEP